MRTFLAPNGEYITVPEGRVTTFGLSEEQNKLVEKVLPTREYELFHTDAPTDLIAISASSVIIVAAALAVESREMVFDYYAEVGDYTDETVFWIGFPKPPHFGSVSQSLHITCGLNSNAMITLKTLPPI